MLARVAAEPEAAEWGTVLLEQAVCLGNRGRLGPMCWP